MTIQFQSQFSILRDTLIVNAEHSCFVVLHVLMKEIQVTRKRRVSRHVIIKLIGYMITSTDK